MARPVSPVWQIGGVVCVAWLAFSVVDYWSTGQWEPCSLYAVWVRSNAAVLWLTGTLVGRLSRTAPLMLAYAVKQFAWFIASEVVVYHIDEHDWFFFHSALLGYSSLRFALMFFTLALAVVQIVCHVLLVIAEPVSDAILVLIPW